MDLLREIRHNPLFWLLALVPALFVVELFKPDAHTLLFVLSVLAIVPLAALLSRATKSVAARTGDTIGGLLNATLGNLTELLIALAALRAGQYVLVKATIAGAIVANSLFMLGASFLIGGLKHHVQTYNRNNARLQAGMSFLATIALLIPSILAETDPSPAMAVFAEVLSLGLAVLLIVTYGLGLVFSLKTHREFFGGADHAESGEASWPMSLALATLGGATVLVALVSEVFVESLQQAAVALGMTTAFVGFVIVALVGGAAEMLSAFSGARKDRLDLSVAIALGSASQIALFVAPVLVVLSYVIGPTPTKSAILARRRGHDIDRNRNRVPCDQQRAFGMVLGRALDRRLFDFRHDAVLVAAQNSVIRFCYGIPLCSRPSESALAEGLV